MAIHLLLVHVWHRLLLTEALWHDDAFREAKLATHCPVIFVPHFDRNGKLLHTWSLKPGDAVVLYLLQLLSVVLDISSQSTANEIALVGSTGNVAFEFVLSFLHLFLLLIQNCLELLSLDLVRLGLGNLSFWNSPCHWFYGKALAVIVDITNCASAHF